MRDMIKYEPTRCCVACRTRTPKRELLRISLQDNQLAFDCEKRFEGRGAYVCATAACIKLATKRHCFERNLKARGSANDTMQLELQLLKVVGYERG